jgi:hypothetical protein
MITLISYSQLTIQSALFEKERDSFLKTGSDIRIEGLDLTNQSLIAQVQALAQGAITTKLSTIVLEPLSNIIDIQYFIFGIEPEAFTQIITNHKAYVGSGLVQTLTSFVQSSKTENSSLILESSATFLTTKINEQLTITFPRNFPFGPPSFTLLTTLRGLINPWITPEQYQREQDSAKQTITMIIPMTLFDILINATGTISERQDALLIDSPQGQSSNLVTWLDQAFASVYPKYTRFIRETSASLITEESSAFFFVDLAGYALISIYALGLFAVLLLYSCLAWNKQQRELLIRQLLAGMDFSSSKRDYVVGMLLVGLVTVVVAFVTSWLILILTGTAMSAPETSRALDLVNQLLLMNIFLGLILPMLVEGIVIGAFLTKTADLSLPRI